MNIEQTTIKKISLHFVGNKSEEGQLLFSEKAIELSDTLNDVLVDFFLKKIVKTAETYHFEHSSSLQYNEVYNYTKEIIYNKEDFHAITKKIAQQLYDCSDHPMINSGEIYVCYLERIGIDDKYFNAVGIFKTENKNSFIEIEDDFNIVLKEGIDLNKLDKACLILDKEEQEGYQVYMVDNQKNGTETALFWKENFLGLANTENEYFQTKELLVATKDFITNQLNEEFIVSNTDKIDLLNKSVSYFKNSEEFVLEEFNDSIFQSEEIKESFNNFTNNEFQENFQISDQAVKKQARYFKSVIKLDKNFHIYVHGNKEMIENGTDDQGRRYYKLFYENES